MPEITCVGVHLCNQRHGIPFSHQEVITSFFSLQGMFRIFLLRYNKSENNASRICPFQEDAQMVCENPTTQLNLECNCYLHTELQKAMNALRVLTGMIGWNNNNQLEQGGWSNLPKTLRIKCVHKVLVFTGSALLQITGKRSSSTVQKHSQDSKTSYVFGS